MTVFRPDMTSDLVAVVADAGAAGRRLDLRGGGSKRAVGAPVPDADILDMTGFSGVVDYDPAELVLTVGAGTPLAQIETLLAENGQMLAFDPFDHGPIWGGAVGAATIGGIIAAGVGGSRRLSAGGVRDHLLGFTGVSGRGEFFVAGAKVVKNVTGYDLSKLVCGSWGRLVALCEVTLKVMPCPQFVLTLALPGQSLEAAVASMSAALGSQAGVAAAAYLPGAERAEAITALRLEGFEPSVRARVAILQKLFGGEVLRDAAGGAIWERLRTLSPSGETGALWRISIPAKGCAGLVAALKPQGPYLVDWAGGLVWLNYEGPPDALRQAAEAAGGHALLLRAGEATRAVVPALHPQPQPLALLEARVRRAFDPAGVFETGRFGRIPPAN